MNTNNQDPLAYEEPDPSRPASAAPQESEIEQQPPTVKPLDYSPPPPGHDPYAALRVKAYRMFSIGWMAAVIGNQMTGAALGWEIFDRTGSKLALGWLAGVQVIPLVLLALPAGVLADRFDRRRLIQITAALNALCSVGLALCSYRPHSVPLIFFLVIASATALTLGRPARAALLPNIVPMSVFSNAVTWNSSVFHVSSMIGPAVGGLLISVSMRWFGNLALPYLLDASTALFYATMMFFIARPASEAMLKMRAREASALGQLAAGIRFVWNTRIIFATLSLDLFAVLMGGAVYLLPVFAKDVLKVSAFKFGLLRAGEAIGAFTMAIILAHLPPMKKAGRAMLVSVGLFGLCTIGFGLSQNFWFSLSMLVLIGAFDNISVVVRHTLVQVMTPDYMRGRVSAVNNIFIGASNELGGFESGLTAQWFGPVKSVVFGGIGTLLTVLITAIVCPPLRRYGALQPHAVEPLFKGEGASVPPATSAT